MEDLYARQRLELIADDYVAHGPGAEPNTLESPTVRAEGREAVRKSLQSKPADVSLTVEEQIAEGDTVMSRITSRSAGKTCATVAIQRIVDGKLVETWRIANRG